ncbi:MAG: ABC transporter permease [Myxococcales bacterium]|nr:ABC transporter permease [Myxococcales bacterium]MCB9530614.1 ABC transporter permease [Myxococcales bacterium]
MTRYLLGRVAQSFAVLLVVLTASFFVMKAAPGSPLARDRQLDPEVEAQLTERYHLDEPVTVQYARYVALLARGDLGPSIKQNAPVAEIIADAAPYSVVIGAQAMLFALALGVPLGLIAGLRQNRAADHAAMAVAMIGVSIPNFVLGPLLILTLASGLGLFRSGGWTGWPDSILPSISLGLYYTAYVARLTRSGMVEVVRQDFIRTARAKGVPELWVVARHAVRGALLPVVSYLGPAFASVLTGSVVVEKVFNVPGLGTFFVDAAFNRDYFLVLGVITVYSALLVALNLAVDLLYTALDPRVSVRR